MSIHKPQRTLIVDDSVVFRSFMRRCLGDIDAIEVVGTANDGEMALRQVEKLQPDLITLDMEMPLMNGIDVLRVLHAKVPNSKVIVVSCETETCAVRTLEALEAGACDFIIKPTASNGNAQKTLTNQLKRSARVAQTVAQVVRFKNNAKQQQTMVTKTTWNPKMAFKPDIIAIGSSTGGPAALSQVIKNLPDALAVPVVITQHMPKLFVQSLAQRLDKESALTCKVAEDGMVLQKGHVYLAPGEIHMEILKQGVKMAVRLVDGPKMHHCKPAVDRTFFSLAKLAPMINTLAVVLTGMGRDGADGAMKIHAANGHVIAQDEASSSVWGMPGATVKLGAAHQVLALNDIAGMLCQMNHVDVKRGGHAAS